MMHSSDSQATLVLRSLRQIIRSVDLHSQQLRRSIGLTGPQLIILTEIHKKPGLTAGDLSKAVTLSGATVTSVLDRLEAKGLVVRVRSEQDRRRVSLTLTPEAEDRISRSPSPLQEEFLEKFIHLEPWEQSQLVASLQRIATLMNAQSLKVEPVLAMDMGLELDRNIPRNSGIIEH